MIKIEIKGLVAASSHAYQVKSAKTVEPSSTKNNIIIHFPLTLRQDISMSKDASDKALS